MGERIGEPLAASPKNLHDKSAERGGWLRHGSEQRGTGLMGERIGEPLAAVHKNLHDKSAERGDGPAKALFTGTQDLLIQ